MLIASNQPLRRTLRLITPFAAAKAAPSRVASELVRRRGRFAPATTGRRISRAVGQLEALSVQ